MLNVRSDYRENLFGEIYEELSKPKILAGGVEATNFLNWENVVKDSVIFNETAKLLADRVTRNGADCLIAVPNGAIDITQRVSELTGIFCIEGIRKIKKTREIKSNKQVLNDISQFQRKMAIDDILTSGSSLFRLNNLLHDFGGIDSAIVIWDRDPTNYQRNANIRRNLGYLPNALIRQYVPFVNSEDH